MNITLICVGKLKEKFYEDAVAEYCKRLRAYCKINIIELPEKRSGEKIAEKEILMQLEKEADEIKKKITSGCQTVAMCVEGTLISSEKLASMFRETAVHGSGDWCFIIGGSYGLAESIKQQCKYRISMSKMTFPHHLARVMLLEQIYRGFKINSGEEYHK